MLRKTPVALTLLAAWGVAPVRAGAQLDRCALRCPPAEQDENTMTSDEPSRRQALPDCAESAQIEALIHENAVLTRALGRAQQWCARQAAEHAAAMAKLQAELTRWRADRVICQASGKRCILVVTPADRGSARAEDIA